MAKQNPRRPNTPASQRPAQPQQPTTPQPAQTPARKTPVRKTPAAPAVTRRPEKKGNLFTAPTDRTLLYTRKHFIIMGVGLFLVLLGLALMAGGAMPDPNVWEPSRIYSFRRITLAPIVMVAGFVVVVFGIFKKNPGPKTEDLTTTESE